MWLLLVLGSYIEAMFTLIKILILVFYTFAFVLLGFNPFELYLQYATT